MISNKANALRPYKTKPYLIAEDEDTTKKLIAYLRFRGRKTISLAPGHQVPIHARKESNKPKEASWFLGKIGPLDPLEKKRTVVLMQVEFEVNFDGSCPLNIFLTSPSSAKDKRVVSFNVYIVFDVQTWKRSKFGIRFVVIDHNDWTLFHRQATNRGSPIDDDEVVVIPLQPSKKRIERSSEEGEEVDLVESKPQELKKNKSEEAVQEKQVEEQDKEEEEESSHHEIARQLSRLSESNSDLVVANPEKKLNQDAIELAATQLFIRHDNDFVIRVENKLVLQAMEEYLKKNDEAIRKAVFDNYEDEKAKMLATVREQCKAQATVEWEAYMATQRERLANVTAETILKNRDVPGYRWIIEKAADIASVRMENDPEVIKTAAIMNARNAMLGARDPIDQVDPNRPVAKINTGIVRLSSPSTIAAALAKAKAASAPTYI